MACFGYSSHSFLARAGQIASTVVWYVLKMLLYKAYIRNVFNCPGVDQSGVTPVTFEDSRQSSCSLSKVCNAIITLKAPCIFTTEGFTVDSRNIVHVHALAGFSLAPF